MNTLLTTTAAVVLTGHGGVEKLDYRTDAPVLRPRPDEVLIAVAAAGVHHTDVNTRRGWYTQNLEQATNEDGAAGFDAVREEGVAWSGTPLSFPRIQGPDVAGAVVAFCSGVAASRIGSG